MNRMEAKVVKPLEKLRIKVLVDDVEKEIPALSRHWWTKRETIYYDPPPSYQFKEMGAKENWLTRMEAFVGELEWLLSLEFHRFWSQIVYDEQALQEIKSFLQEGTPFYVLKNILDEYDEDDDNLWEMYKKVHQHIFWVLCRLTTLVESETEFMTSEFYAKLVYEKYIITVPMLLDICLLYGKENRAVVSNMISQIFQVQSKYKKDLKKTVPVLRKVLKYVEERFGSKGNPRDLTKLTERDNEQNQMPLYEFQDLVLNVLDTAININMFLDIYPPACTIFHESLLELKIAHFYENTIPRMYKKLNALVNKDDNQEMFQEVTLKLGIIRHELLKIFRYCLASCVTALLENSEQLKEGEVKKIVDDYVNVLSECLSEVIFIRDYHSTYPVEVDLDVLSQVCPEMDSMKRDFILESVLACFDYPKSNAQKNKSSRVENVNSSQTGLSAASTGNAANVPDSACAAIVKKVKKKNVKGVELDSLITEVKDILPHLGEGFIEKCLQHFDFNTEAVISKVLEDTLPQELKSLDFTLERILNDTEVASNGTERLNVFDNDEFDIMTQDEVDTSRIHKGKRKSEYKNLNQMIDDKGHRDEFREMYSKLGLVEDGENIYDDEYDDTYDGVDVSVGEEGDIEGRPFVVPRVLAAKQVVNSESDSETEEEQNGASETVKDAFVQNPEEVRAKAEQRRQLKQQQKYRKFPPRNTDVVGREKGKGQDKQTIQNRDHKTVHKSVYSNHNRRMGAQRKKQQGMI